MDCVRYGYGGIINGMVWLVNNWVSRIVMGFMDLHNI